MTGPSRRIARLTREIDEGIANAPLSNLLPKVIQLAKAIDVPSLAKWARLEFEGYTRENREMDDTVVVPTYRTVPGRHYNSAGIVLHVANPDLDFINEDRLRYGVAELEQLADRDGEIRTHNPGMAELINEHLGIEAYSFGFSATSVKGTLSAIRSHLIEQLAELDLPDEPDPAHQPTRGRPSILRRVSGWILAETWRIVTGILIIIIASIIAVYLGIAT